jgi:hypothetical protein
MQKSTKNFKLYKKNAAFDKAAQLFLLKWANM